MNTETVQVVESHVANRPRAVRRQYEGYSPGRGSSALLQGAKMAVAALAFVVCAAQAAFASQNALMLSSTVTGGTSSLEYAHLVSSGWTVTLTSSLPVTASGYSTYQLLVFGDPNCGSVSDLSNAEATRSVWSSLINGNVIIIGTDPALHSGSEPGAVTLINNSLDFAGAQFAANKLGLYCCLSCDYDSAPANTTVTVLDMLDTNGLFKVQGATCWNDICITATHPALAGLTNAALSNWSCSSHEIFNSYPFDFIPLATCKNYPGGAFPSCGDLGAPYILVRGAGVTTTEPAVGANKDFQNNTGTTVNDIEWLIQGSYSGVLLHYDGPYPGESNSTFSSFTVSPSGSNTLLTWSGTASIPPGGFAHVGFKVPGTSLTTIGASWTINGAFAGCAHQVSIGTGHSHLLGGSVAFENTATNCESAVLYVGNIKLLWFLDEVPLPEMNSGGALSQNPLQTNVIPGPPVSIPPNGEAILSIPLPPPAANFVMIEYTVSADSMLAGPGNTVDFVQYTLTAESLGTSFCDPGVGGVLACPCANPPSAPDRGCDNSSATGGAQLTGSGLASLSADTVQFTSTGEKPTATSIFLQGTAPLVSGVVFGQGVRCVGGSLKRLYVHNAVAGTVSAPIGADPSVSNRSAALGDPITPGTNRYYGVYYRDPTVLGGCPGMSTFNITQQLGVLWAP